MIDSIRITHDELEGGTYRVLADFFRIAGIHVCGYVPGKNDNAGKCDVCIYIPSKNYFDAKSEGTKAEGAEESGENKSNASDYKLVLPTTPDIKLSSPYSLLKDEKTAKTLKIVKRQRINEIDMGEIQDKETYKAAQLAAGAVNPAADSGWDSAYRGYVKDYLLACINQLEKTQLMKNSAIIHDDMNALRALANVFVDYDLLLHYNAYMVLYDEETTLQEAQDAFSLAYREFRESTKKLPESRYSLYARMNIAKWINETCQFLGQRLMFDTGKCLNVLDQILEKYPTFYNVYVLKAYFAEIDPEYDHLSEAFYQKALDSMTVGNCESYPCYRMGRYYEKIKKDIDNANQKYELAYYMDSLDYRAVYKKIQAEKNRGEYLRAAESCKEICRILHKKEAANYLHPKEQEYLFKAYNELANIYGASYKNSAEYEAAENGRRRMMNGIKKENRMYKIIFGDRASEYAERMYNWLDNCKKY